MPHDVIGGGPRRRRRLVGGGVIGGVGAGAAATAGGGESDDGIAVVEVTIPDSGTRTALRELARRAVLNTARFRFAEISADAQVAAGVFPSPVSSAELRNRVLAARQR